MPDQTISPTGIPSAEAWGTPTVTQPATQFITVTGIPSAEAWGTPTVTDGGATTIYPTSIT